MSDARPDPLLERYVQALERQADGLPALPSAALRERILQAAQQHQEATQFIASQPALARASSENSMKKPMLPAANDSFWNIRAAASLAVMGLGALLWWHIDPQSAAEPAPSRPALNTPSSASQRPNDAVSLSSAEPVGRVAPHSEKADSRATAPAPRAASESARLKPAEPPAQSGSAKLETSESAAALAGATATADSQPMPSSAPSARLSRAAPAPASASPPALVAAPDPLWQALAARDVGALQQALAQGASAQARDAQGQTALHLAVLQRWPQGVRLLLQAGADPRATNKNGHTAADVAKENGFTDISAIFEGATR